MNFLSYVAEISRGWDEPSARDMGRMKSRPNTKGEMYILNDGIDMKAKCGPRISAQCVSHSNGELDSFCFRKMIFID